MSSELTRRALLARGALGAGALALPWRLPAARAAGLPDAAAVRADVQRMVDFGPRLCGSDAHAAFVAWLEQEFTRAGCRLLPCDVYETARWIPGTYGLTVAGQPVRVATYFPRSRETPGVDGPLVYAGPAPQPASELASWAHGLPSAIGDPRGSILLVDLQAPLPTTAGVLAADATFYNGQGESEAQLLTDDYKRLWLHPGLAMPLDAFTALGVAGVVLILDASYEALRGAYLPFEWKDEGVPALYVDRETGAALRAQAGTRPPARLTLDAARAKVPIGTVTAVLPGRSPETLIFNTHTDGQGFVEENGPVAFLHLARYFAQRPLERTLVFAAWPGHMSNDLPQAQGWIDAHGDLVARAAAALTVEHLGCTEWNDTAAGYQPTGRAELFAIWASQGPMADLTRAAVVKHDLPRTAILRPPIQFGVGGPFEQAGVPEIGAIAGPEYLLTISPNGEMDKFDPALAARQIAFLADLATALDGVSAAALRAGDPTLGSPAPKGNIFPSSAVPKPAQCFVAPAAAGRTVEVRWFGRRRRDRGVVLVLRALRGAVGGVTVEIVHRGRVVARSAPLRVGARRRRVVLRGRFPHGSYTIVVRARGREIARRAVAR